MKNFILLLCFLVCLCLFCFGMWRIFSVEVPIDGIGRKALLSLYDFDSLDEFESNIEVFHSYVTDEVFDKMTADNTDRMLLVYLKFRGNPTKVKIWEEEEDHIIYSLLSDSMEAERRFFFGYDVEDGKITSIREGELIPFPTTIDWGV